MYYNRKSSTFAAKYYIKQTMRTMKFLMVGLLLMGAITTNAPTGIGEMELEVKQNNGLKHEFSPLIVL